MYIKLAHVLSRDRRDLWGIHIPVPELYRIRQVQNFLSTTFNHRRRTPMNDLLYNHSYHVLIKIDVPPLHNPSRISIRYRRQGFFES